MSLKRYPARSRTLADFVQMTLTVFSATAGQAFYLDNALLTY